jgi:hypothetical protein
MKTVYLVIKVNIEDDVDMLRLGFECNHTITYPGIIDSKLIAIQEWEPTTGEPDEPKAVVPDSTTWIEP